MKKYKIGYTQGTYDMFHIGHLNLINNAKQYCDYLIVGVNSDSLVYEYKNKIPVVNQNARREIVANIRAVDKCVISTTLDKIVSWELFRYDAIFIGDDWKGNSRWEDTKNKLGEVGVDVIFLPYTEGINSTELRVVKNVAIKE